MGAKRPKASAEFFDLDFYGRERGLKTGLHNPSTALYEKFPKWLDAVQYMLYIALQHSS